jgi:purine-nucleoside phosphorylase
MADSILPLAAQIDQAVAHIRRHYGSLPVVGIVLGTGLCSLADGIQAEAVLPYAEIPHFPRCTADSHKGELVCGTLAGVPIVAMAGRQHGYEGRHRLGRATLPIRVMRGLGAQVVILSNAAGGLNPYYRNGDLMVIVDHINLMRDTPLTAHAAFDMSRPYDRALIEEASKIARREDVICHRGVYVGVSGPNLETRAEYRMLRRIGGDAVGMSTVPEALVAAHCGLRVLAFSIISNVCLPDALRPVSIEQIVATCNQAEPKLRRIVLRLLESGRIIP